MVTRQGQTIEGTRGLVNLERALIETLKNAKTLDGQPEFPQPGKTIREAQQAGEQKAQQNAANTDFDTGNQGANEPIPFFRGGGSDDESGLSDQNRSSGPDPISYALNGLATIAGVLTPGGGSPAAAGELPAEVINEDQVETLARMWSGRERPSLQVPGLPQMDANTQTTSVPTAIRNDRHPFFIAIGIAEGTRTADGGYTQNYYGHTDIGDGNLNRGTVSGGRGNALTPQQVDQRWMSRLTQTSLRMQGVLRGVGLQPGTQGFNRVMFNVLDLSVQAPLAVRLSLPS